MNKKRAIHELTNLLAIALRHKIGSIVNPDEIYAQKYAKDAEILMKEAMKISAGINWSIQDKTRIRDEVKVKLRLELEKKDFLDNKKFEIMDDEIEKALKMLGLS